MDPAMIWTLEAQVRPLLDQAVERGHGRCVTEVILQECARGESQLWLVLDGEKILVVAITELVTFPTGRRVCRLTYAAGQQLWRWVHLISGVEDFARAELCDAVSIHGRPGWGRVFSGYTELYRVFEKEV